MDPTDPARSLGHAIGKIPSGLFVVTAGRGRSETAMLASWVQQCSFEPPMLSMALGHGRPFAELLKVGEPFTVNVLAEGQKHLLAHFGKGFEAGEPAFERIAIERADGFPPLLTDALAHLACRVVHRLRPGGDHDLMIGQVIAGRVHHDGRPTVHVRKSGLHY
jgi:flavin reductase (DIM6/NTAB) family NADH-FMN oxidoreductase RutF